MTNTAKKNAANTSQCSHLFNIPSNDEVNLEKGVFLVQLSEDDPWGEEI
jgi:hypothetical protein